MDLTDRVIVITGASSGIGEATAIACAKAGMNVVVSARREDRLEDVADRIRRLKRQAAAVACDVNRDVDVTRLVSAAMDRFGHIDAFFANAGYGIMTSVEDTTDQQARDIFETNFHGTVRCIRAVMPIFRKQNRGHLLVCSSVVSELAIPMYGYYAATKAAQDAITAALRAEVTQRDIHITSVHPTGTATEFSQVVRQQANVSKVTPNTPAWLQQTPQQVASAIVRCLRRPRAEVWPSPLTRYIAAFATLCPSVAAWALRRYMTPRMQPLSDAADKS